MSSTYTFTPDGCTGWLDGWPTWLGGKGNEWLHCCNAHDQFYLDNHGAGVWSYWGAHYDLAQCVWEVSPSMAVTMFAGLATFGTLFTIWKENRLTFPGLKKPKKDDK